MCYILIRIFTSLPFFVDNYLKQCGWKYYLKDGIESPGDQSDNI